MELAKSAYLTKEEHAPAQTGLLAHPTAKTGLWTSLMSVDHNSI